MAYIEVPALSGNRVIRLPDVSGEIITTGNVDVLFGGGDGGRDLSSASISEKLTVKGNTFLGDDRADGISFGGSVQQVSKSITGFSVLRNGTMYAKDHGLQEGDFFVLSGVLSGLPKVQNSLNGFLFRCKNVLDNDRFEADNATRVGSLLLAENAYSGQFTKVSGEKIVMGESWRDGKNIGVGLFSEHDILAAHCSGGNSSSTINAPLYRVGENYNLNSMMGTTEPSNMDSLKCTFAKVEGAFGFENDDNIYSDLNISVTLIMFDTRPDNINVGDVYRVVSLEEI